MNLVRGLLFKLLLASPAVGAAQESILPISHATWRAHFWDPWTFDDTETLYLEPMDHDTLINDTTYSVVWGYDEDSSAPGAVCGGLFDNGQGQVFYHHNFSNGTYLLYDFDVLPGDSIAGVWAGSTFGDFASTWTVYVVQIDSVSIDGDFHRAIGLVGFPPEIAGYDPVNWWIEGVGGSNGLLGTIGVMALDVSGGLECMSHGDTILWQYGPFGYPGNCLSVGMEDRDLEGRSWFHPTVADEALFIDLHPSDLSAIEILSTDGRPLRRQSGSSAYVNVAALLPGTYLLRVSDPGKAARCGRFIKR